MAKLRHLYLKGSTLIEVMLAVVIILVVFLVFSVFTGQLMSARNTNDELYLINNLRYTIDSPAKQQQYLVKKELVQQTYYNSEKIRVTYKQNAKIILNYEQMIPATSVDSMFQQ